MILIISESLFMLLFQKIYLIILQFAINLFKYLGII
jgi:hypothetical protein